MQYKTMRKKEADNGEKIFKDFINFTFFSKKGVVQ